MDLKSGYTDTKQFLNNAYNNYKNQKLVSGSIAMLVWAVVLISIGVISIGVVFSQANFVPIVFIGVGVFLLNRRHDKRKRLTNGYEKLVLSGCYRITQLAAHNKVTQADAEKHIRQMIDYGYFQDAFVDSEAHQIIIKQRPNPTDLLWKEDVINCKGCGGPNTVVVGKVSKCEWCGVPIKQTQVKPVELHL